MALIPMEYDDLVTKAFGNPAVTYTAGTIGTFGNSGTVDVSVTGYTPIAVMLKNVSGAGSGIPVLVLNGNTLYFLFYRTATSQVTVAASAWTALVLYKKNITQLN